MLNYYISSFSDNALGLKMFLNDEIGRLKSRLQEALEIEEIKNDGDMIEKTQKVFEKLDDFKNKGIHEHVVLTVLRTQQLEQEIFENGN